MQVVEGHEKVLVLLGIEGRLRGGQLGRLVGGLEGLLLLVQLGGQGLALGQCAGEGWHVAQELVHASSCESRPKSPYLAVSGRMSCMGLPTEWQGEQSREYSSRPAARRVPWLTSRCRFQRAVLSSPWALACSNCPGSRLLEYMWPSMM